MEPERVSILVSRELAAQLIHYDHHRVLVEGRWGILLTYHWDLTKENNEPLTLELVFSVARAYLSPEQQLAAILKHPVAPKEIQEMIHKLSNEKARVIL
jgi:hypothetical protein